MTAKFSKRGSGRSLFQNKLNDVFDRVYVHGVVEVPRAELLLWHDNQSKVTKKLWRNVQEAWVKRCEEEWEDAEAIPQLLRAYNPYTQTYVLLWRGEKDDETGEFEPWFKPLSEVDEKAENVTDE